MKPNQFSNLIKNTTYALVTICSIIITAMVILTALAADAKEYTNKALERERARVQWIAENGEYQKNLTEEGEKQARAYVSIKQAEINKE